MIKFEKDNKINFVDINNVFVGYDLHQSCCENADWFISNKEETLFHNESGTIITYSRCLFDIGPYSFDKKYFEEISGDNFDFGGMVRFKLVAEDKQNLYLHLYNCQNGCYGHGFESKIGDTTWLNGLV